MFGHLKRSFALRNIFYINCVAQTTLWLDIHCIFIIYTKMIFLRTVTNTWMVTYIFVHNTVFGTCWDDFLVDILLTDWSHARGSMELNDTGKGKEVSILDMQVLKQPFSIQMSRNSSE